MRMRGPLVGVSGLKCGWRQIARTPQKLYVWDIQMLDLDESEVLVSFSLFSITGNNAFDVISCCCSKY
jgi:hypothetical protein